MKNIFILSILLIDSYTVKSQCVTSDSSAAINKRKVELSVGYHIFTSITKDIPNWGFWSPRTKVEERSNYNLWYETKYFLPITEISLQFSENIVQSVGASYNSQKFVIDDATVTGTTDSIHYKSYYIFYKYKHLFVNKSKRLFFTKRYLAAHIFFARKQLVDYHEFQHFLTGTKSIYSENNLSGSLLMTAGVNKSLNRFSMEYGMNYNLFTIGKGVTYITGNIMREYLSILSPDYLNSNLGLFGKYGRISHSPISFTFKISYQL